MTEDDADRMQDALWHIKQWCEAYPVEVFPEPDLARCSNLLGADMDKLHASWARHILSGVERYAREGLGLTRKDPAQNAGPEG